MLSRASWASTVIDAPLQVVCQRFCICLAGSRFKGVFLQRWSGEQSAQIRRGGQSPLGRVRRVGRVLVVLHRRARKPRRLGRWRIRAFCADNGCAENASNQRWRCTVLSSSPTFCAVGTFFPFQTRGQRIILPPPSNGGRSSMVEPQIVILVVAGSSPVDHPIFPIGIPREVRAGEEEIKQIN